MTASSGRLRLHWRAMTPPVAVAHSDRVGRKARDELVESRRLIFVVGLPVERRLMRANRQRWRQLSNDWIPRAPRGVQAVNEHDVALVLRDGCGRNQENDEGEDSNPMSTHGYLHPRRMFEYVVSTIARSPFLEMRVSACIRVRTTPSGIGV